MQEEGSKRRAVTPEVCYTIFIQRYNNLNGYKIRLFISGHKRGKDKAAKNVLVMSSKAKGKDRLTGRARRSVTAKHNPRYMLFCTHWDVARYMD